ncbi:MAG: hydroxyacylglutathione hydrolase [Candidatus Hydrogenedentota bacterium]
MSCQVVIIPTLKDNYSYVVRSRDGKHVAVVDPGEAAPLLKHFEETGTRPDEIWLTHKHTDHIGGATDLANKYDVVIRGPDELPRFQARTETIQDGGKFKLGASEVTVRKIPGHTAGHLVYFTEHVVFSGDVLFLGGCGRIFEGSPREMFLGIDTHLRGLPANTLLFCGHEYAERNMRFALTLEPGNPAIQKQFTRVQSCRALGRPTVPGEMGIEQAVNPFLRVRSSSLRRALEAKVGPLPNDPAEVFTILRTLRNEFR